MSSESSAREAERTVSAIVKTKLPLIVREKEKQIPQPQAAWG
jgi:hypothetical protein